MKKISVVLSAYNEEKHIVQVIRRIKQVRKKNKLNLDIIIANDGSSDRTEKLAKKENVIVLNHIINLGKGAVAKTGCDYAYKKGYNIIILMDSDGQHEPEDIPRFLTKLKDVDIVFSYRKGGNSPFFMNIGNFGLTVMSKILFGKGVRDTQSGFRAFKREAYPKIRWISSNYEMESEMIYRSKGLTYAQIPIKKIYHDKNKGTTISDGLKIGYTMIKWTLFGGKQKSGIFENNKKIRRKTK